MVEALRYRDDSEHEEPAVTLDAFPLAVRVVASRRFFACASSACCSL